MKMLYLGLGFLFLAAKQPALAVLFFALCLLTRSSSSR